MPHRFIRLVSLAPVAMPGYGRVIVWLSTQQLELYLSIERKDTKKSLATPLCLVPSGEDLSVWGKAIYTLTVYSFITYQHSIMSWYIILGHPGGGESLCFESMILIAYYHYDACQ